MRAKPSSSAIFLFFIIVLSFLVLPQHKEEKLDGQRLFALRCEPGWQTSKDASFDPANPLLEIRVEVVPLGDVLSVLRKLF